MSPSSHPTRQVVRRKVASLAAKGGSCCAPRSSCCGDAVGTEGAVLRSDGQDQPAKNRPVPVPKAVTGARVQVFDPALCCATGVCGPSVDPKLVRFAADLEWLKGQGVTVERFNLAQQALAFAGDDAVKAALQERGEAALPLIKVNGEVVGTGAYPTREQLADWSGLNQPAPSLFTEAVQELVALGAAIVANCESCFRFHYDRARKLGVSREDMLRAVRTAQGVKEAPAKSVLKLAERYLIRQSGQEAPADATSPSCEEPGPAGGCCG